MLQAVNITKKYKKKIAVDNLCFTVNKGDVLGLIGANGAGKSTIISIIATLIKPDKGAIFYKEKNIVTSPHVIRKDMGFVPQDIALYMELSGMDNLKFWGKTHNIYKDKLERQISQVQDIIGFTLTDLKEKVKNYSGGMKRRLNIGAALLHQPELVIMDEPTVGIDIISRKKILKTIQEINEAGTTVIYTGHYLEEIEQICNRICIMDAGKMIITGEKEKLLEKGYTSLEQFYISTTVDSRERQRQN